MKFNQKLLISVLVSSQLLGVGVPLFSQINVVHAAENAQIGIPELFEELTENGTYSTNLNNELLKLLDESNTIESYGDARLLVDKFTTLHTKVSREDIHKEADLYMLDKFKALEIHGNIFAGIVEYGDANLMLRYLNQLVMGYVEETPAFEGLIVDVIENHKMEKASKEIIRVKNMFELYKEKYFEAGYPEIKVSIVNDKLYSKDLEFMLGDDIYKETIERPGFIDKTDEFELPDIEIPKVDKEDSEPGYKPKPNSHTPDVGLAERSGSYYEYDANKGIRYLVTYRIRIVNGKEERTETRRIDATGLSSLWSDRIYSFSGGDADFTQLEGYEPEQEEIEIEQKLTLQYSLNKDDLFPSYIDTGIYTDENGNADYKSMYDALYQISVNATDGYLVEDKDKLLIVVEGIPIYIVESKDTYTKSEIENVFSDFKGIDLLVRDTRIGTTDTLEWQLRTGKTQALIVDGDKIDLITQPEVRANRVVLPIIETFEAIGAEITENDGVMLATYKGISIKLEKGVSEARIDDKLIDMVVPVDTSERGFYTGNITPIFKEIGVNAEWDEQESSLFISNTERKKTTEKDSAKDSVKDENVEVIDE